MPLFECSNCVAIENTALSDYWSQDLDHHVTSKGMGKVDPEPFKPKCSECLTGKWHGEFPKRIAKEAGYVPDPKMQGMICAPRSQS